MTDKFVLVSHCILAQSVKSKSNIGTAMVNEVVQFCMDHNINMLQMPCPEMLTIGIDRPPHGKKYYDENTKIREVSAKIAIRQVIYIKYLLKNDRQVLGIIGVMHSPACSTIQDSKSPYMQEGIYIEELRKELKNQNLNIPMISVTSRWKNRMMNDLNSLLTGIAK